MILLFASEGMRFIRFGVFIACENSYALTGALSYPSAAVQAGYLKEIDVPSF